MGLIDGCAANDPRGPKLTDRLLGLLNRIYGAFPSAWLLCATFLVAQGAIGAHTSVASESGGSKVAEPFRFVVMDPLCDQLACDCVVGYAQRKYQVLAELLERELRREVLLAYTESLGSLTQGELENVDLISGKFSVVRHDARRHGLNLRTLAMLSGKDGAVTQRGLFVVRRDDPAKSIADLQGYRIVFGPEDSIEKHSAAIASLEAFGLPVSKQMLTSSDCSTAAIAVDEEEADAAVISSYAMPLLEGCGAIEKGSLRIVGRTDPVPLIGLFATDRFDRENERALHDAFAVLGDNPRLLAALESKDGYVQLAALVQPGEGPQSNWADWRGPHRDAISRNVPQKLSSEPRLLWSRVLTGPGMSGIAVDRGNVVVSDKSLDEENDVFRCLDADTGEQIWKLEYPAPGRMDFTNSPRATPVIREGFVYLMGAFGHLHCLRLESGEIVWRRSLAADFRAEVPTWGYCSTPLLVDNKLIVNAGGKDASLVALDRQTGEVLWTTPGDPPGYAGFVLGEFGGVRQVVGYDAISLGGWDPDSGRRLWRLLPELDGDFNVPTPVIVGDTLLVSTENNGTRIYGFDRHGRINPEPLAASNALAPDTSTPVIHNGIVLGNFGGLVCLDLDDGLKLLWETQEDPFVDYCSFIAGEGRVLVTSQTGKLCLLEGVGRGFDCVSTLDLFPNEPATERDVWSQPALVGKRLYIRNLLAAYCFLLE